MLLIRCPYCEQDRAEVEFAYAGEAHIERPADPSALSDAEWESFLFLRANPRGTHFERWYHVQDCDGGTLAIGSGHADNRTGNRQQAQSVSHR